MHSEDDLSPEYIASLERDYNEHVHIMVERFYRNNHVDKSDQLMEESWNKSYETMSILMKPLDSLYEYKMKEGLDHEEASAIALKTMNEPDNRKK